MTQMELVNYKKYQTKKKDNASFQFKGEEEHFKVTLTVSGEEEAVKALAKKLAHEGGVSTIVDIDIESKLVEKNTKKLIR
jgi:hypothetical protein